MKVCKDCLIEKELIFFEKKGDYFRMVCKRCVSVKKKMYYIKNKESICIKQKVHKENNKENIKIANKLYYQENKDSAYKRRGLRSRTTIDQTPAWLTRNQRKEIRSFYKKAQELSRNTGIKYSVDHIIPIISKYVCGLHIPINLRVIPLSDNLSKGNRI
jgi:hypothetical protein